MRGEDQRSERLFSYVGLEARIPADHPLRAIRTLTDEALTGLSRDFNRLYAREGRPSIPPERLLRALLLQAFYTVRSERQLIEQLDYNLLFRWFVGLSIDDSVAAFTGRSAAAPDDHPGLSDLVSDRSPDRPGRS
jgi:transposase